MNKPTVNENMDMIKIDKIYKKRMWLPRKLKSLLKFKNYDFMKIVYVGKFYVWWKTNMMAVNEKGSVKQSRSNFIGFSFWTS